MTPNTTPTPESTAPALAEMSIGQLRAHLDGETAAAPRKEEAAAPPAKPETPATPAAEEATSAPDSGTDKTAEEPEEAELPKGVQKRIQKEIDKAVKARKEAERFRDELAAKLQATAPDQKPEAAASADRPKAESYADYEEFVEALTDWKLELREKTRQQAELKSREQAAQQAALTEWQKRAEIERKKYSDYDEVLADASIPITPAMHEALLTSEAGPALAYHLAKHPAECQRLAALSPVAAVRELTRLESSLTPAPPSTEKPAAKPLPKPPATVSGAVTPAVDLNTCSMSVFKREIEKLRG